MTRSLRYWAGLVLFGACLFPHPAFADHNSGHRDSVKPGTDSGGMWFQAASESHDSQHSEVASHAAVEGSEDMPDLPRGELLSVPACESGGSATCRDLFSCSDGSIMLTWSYITADGKELWTDTRCPSDAVPAAGDSKPMTVTPGQVLKAFRRVPLPESEVMIPPHGETLVGFPTNAYTEAEAFTENITFFGGRLKVVLTIEPSSFTWHRGDGTSQTTDWPGRAWQRSDGEEQVGLITHAYDAKAQDVSVSVDTTWSATWTLNGKDMGEVPGTVTIEGGAKPLDVLEARPTLVG